MDLKSKIRVVENFPVQGISFKDITTLLYDNEAYRYAIDKLAENLKKTEFDVIVGPEARGFIFGSTLAYVLGKPFVPIRKKGKLPHETISVTYDLEYGQDSLYIHKDAIKKGDKVVILDDLLATGGTIGAAKGLIESAGASLVKAAFLIELDFLNAREKLNGLDIYSLVHYDN